MEKSMVIGAALGLAIVLAVFSFGYSSGLSDVTGEAFNFKNFFRPKAQPSSELTSAVKEASQLGEGTYTLNHGDSITVKISGVTRTITLFGVSDDHADLGIDVSIRRVLKEGFPTIFKFTDGEILIYVKKAYDSEGIANDRADINIAEVIADPEGKYVFKHGRYKIIDFAGENKVVKLSGVSGDNADVSVNNNRQVVKEGETQFFPLENVNVRVVKVFDETGIRNDKATLDIWGLYKTRTRLIGRADGEDESLDEREIVSSVGDLVLVSFNTIKNHYGSENWQSTKSALEICSDLGYGSCFAGEWRGSQQFYKSTDSSCVGKQMQEDTVSLVPCSTRASGNTPLGCTTIYRDGLAEPFLGDTDGFGRIMQAICFK
jgi:hypothetical protein